MSDRAKANRLKDLLRRLRDAALTGAGERPSTDELVSAAAEVTADEGIAVIEEVFDPFDKLVMLDLGREVNARKYLQEMLFR